MFLLLAISLTLNFCPVSASETSNNNIQSTLSSSNQLIINQTTVKTTSNTVTPKTVRVLIYNGSGAGIIYINGIKSALNTANTNNLVPGYHFTYTTSPTLTSKILSNYDLLAMPGGTSGKLYINTISASVIRTFVSSGHGYLGICAGAYSGSSSVDGLYNAWGVAPDVRCKPVSYTGNLKITLTSSGSQLLGTSGTITVSHYNGPAMYASGGSVLNFATYSDNTIGYKNYGAIVGDSYGNGRSILSGSHPELTPQYPLLLAKMIIWAANLPTTTTSSFSRAQINSASKTVKTYMETYNKLPAYVSVNGNQITTAQFLQLLTSDLLMINNGSTSTVTLKSVKNPGTATGTMLTGKILESEYLAIANQISSYINTFNTAPSTISSSFGTVTFQSLVYIYSKIIAYYSTNNRLPTYVSITNS